MTSRVYFTDVRPPTPPADEDPVEALLKRIKKLRFDYVNRTPLPRHPRAPVTKVHVPVEIWDEYFMSVDKKRRFENEWRACKLFMKVVKAEMLQVDAPVHDALELVEGLVPAATLSDANLGCHMVHKAFTASFQNVKKVTPPDPDPALCGSRAVLHAFYENLRYVNLLLLNVNVVLRVVNAAMACVRSVDEYGSEGVLRTLLRALPKEAPTERGESLRFVRDRLPGAVEAVHAAAMQCLKDG